MAELTIEVTPAIIADFRAFYEEFSDSAAWSDTKITKALYIARGEFGGCAHWGDYKPYSFFQRGWFALAAHYLTWNKATSDATGADGSASTPYAQSSKSVRDESVSYAIPAANANLTVWEASLALTPYGLEYLHLRSRAAMGAICV
ncbi:DUF4054 domain-containing protein [Pseudomonas sp. Y24-6]|uniref:DUF4054 domain-containing protein n=1 Tax=Pseudomonas sp. Y24-6 TaxID=2750013 RepID=UPI001CE1DF8F|nr:DUF4054 domain-containing protein [Pseudomonas sp. Y24-6]MCA4964904.1 DUF4054 domain-containing protein [Pseudomonas sp. Y24-6]